MYENYPTIAELLLEHGTDVDARSDEGYSALHWASQVGHEDLVRVLIDRGADVNANTTSDETPLMIAHARRELSPEKLDRVIALLKKAGAKEPTAAEAAIKAEMVGLQGTWETISAEINSKPTEKSVGQRMTIKEARLYTGVRVMKEFKEHYRIELHGDEPKQMDLIADRKDGKEVVRLLAIYLLDADTLKVCFGGAKLGERPKDFSSGYGKSITVYKRVEQR